VIDSTIIYF